MEYKYDAFISYRHIDFDKKVASKLQVLLETFKLPKNVAHSKKEKITRIFRDETELPTSGDLSEDIKNALKNSEFLIVICSKETKNSSWCIEEISYFKELHKGSTEKILTLIIDGDPREVFPEELCEEQVIYIDDNGISKAKTVKVEPLAANIVSSNEKNALKKLKVEFLRIAAAILGCNFDDLYQRNERRATRNFINILCGIIVVVLAIGIYAIINVSIISGQNKELIENVKLIEKQQLYRTVSYAKQLIEDGDRVQTAAILSEAYDRFDKNLPEYEAFKEEIEPIMAKTAYFSKYEPYVSFSQEQSSVFSGFNTDETEIVSITITGDIEIWNALNGEKIFEISTGLSVENALLLGDYIVISTVKNEIYVWDIVNNKQINSVSLGEGNGYFVEKMVYNSEINAVICIYYNAEEVLYTYKIIDLEFINGDKEITSFADSLWFGSIDISPNGNFMLVYADDMHSVITVGEPYRTEEVIFDFGEDEYIRQLKITDDGYIYGITVEHEDGSFLGCGVIIYDITNNEIVHKSTIGDVYIDDIYPPEKYGGQAVIFNSNLLGYPLELLTFEDYNYSSKEQIPIFVDMSTVYELHSDITVDYLTDESFLITRNQAQLYMDIVELKEQDGRKIISNVKDLKVFDGFASYIDISQDKEWLLASSNNSLSVLYNIKSSDFQFDDKKYLKQVDESSSFIGVSDNFIALDYYGNLIDLVNDEVVSTIYSNEENGYATFYEAIISPDGTNVFYKDNNLWYLWDVYKSISKEIVELNEFIMDSYNFTVDISDNFKFICYAENGNIYIYDIESGTITYEMPYFAQNIDLFMQDDGKTIIGVDNANFFIYEFDVEKQNTKLVSKLGMIGNLNMDIEAVNWNLGRIILGENLNQEGYYRTCVYSIDTGEILFDFAKLNGNDSTWLFSKNGTVSVAIDREDLGVTTWEIPNFEMIVLETRKVVKGRVLSSEERQSSGLNIFDEH